MKTLLPVLFSLLTAFNLSALALAAPICTDHGRLLPINDEQVATWKRTTQNQFLARGHVTGMIRRVFADHSGHNHFEIQINSHTGDTLEIIYNQSFGALPALRPGMRVEACGDYITSTAQSGSFPPSPDGAILHWIHKSDSPRHDSGYVAIDGRVFGGL